MRRINLLFFSFISMNLLSQANFHNGKLLLKDDSQLDVLIDYSGWIKTPDEISVKYLGETRVYTPDQLKGFSVEGDRYIARSVALDITDQNLQTLSNTINPAKVERYLFLRVLVEGAANLYTYRDTRTHYFSSTSEESNIIELSNLKRLTQSSVSYSKRYVGQLRLLLSDCIESSKINEVQFTTSGLTKITKEYNQCRSGGSDYIAKKNRLHTEFIILGGYKLSGYELPSEGFYSQYELDSNSEGSFTFGLALNINLLRNTERLQLYNELVYQQYGFSAAFRDQVLPQQFTEYQLSFDLSYLELSNLVRFNFSDNTKRLRPFINAGIVNAFKLSDNSKETVRSVFFDTERFREREPLDGQIVSHRLFFTIGAGLEINRVSIEFRYGFNPEISGFPNIVKSDIINLLLGIQLF